MRILAREKGNVGWIPLDSASYSQEAELQELLAASPSIIPLADISENAPELCVAVRVDPCRMPA